jgi:hypothetical protein
MIYWSISPGRSCAIIFVATTLFCLHPHSIAAQDLESKPASTDHAHLAPCSAVHGDELQPTREDLTGNSLSGAPITAGQAQGQAQDPATPFAQQPNQLPGCLQPFLLHEDPRYQRSASTNALRRTFHALAFTQIPAEVLSRRVTSLPLRRADS